MLAQADLARPARADRFTEWRPTGKRRLKVALYYPWIYLTSGGERTILELVRGSRHEWTLYTSHCDPDHTFPELAALPIVQLREVSVKRSIGSVAAAALQIVLQKIPLEQHDALFVVSEGLGDMIMFRNRSRPSLCYCLTPLRAAFDDFYRQRAYAARGSIARLALWAGLGMFRGFDRMAWRRYTRMLFLSKEVVQRSIKGHLPHSTAAEVVYPGIALRGARPSDDFEPFFFLPGRVMWTKNIELGIQAFLRVRSLRPGFAHFRLVVAGGVDDKSRPYLARLRELAAGCPQIEFVVAPSDDELRQLYARCYAVLFTAFNEDLGLTPVEGMAFGKPVIAVDQGGPRETVDDGVHGFRVAADPERFAERMIALLESPDLARRMGQAGFQQAQRFTWDRFVNRVDDVLEEIAGVRTPPAIEASRDAGKPR